MLTSFPRSGVSIHSYNYLDVYHRLYYMYNVYQVEKIGQDWGKKERKKLEAFFQVGLAMLLVPCGQLDIPKGHKSKWFLF